MKHNANELALPTFLAENEEGSIVSGPHILKKTPITALHYHKVAEIGICIFGKGESYIGSKHYEYSEGCIQLIPPGVSHLSNSTGDSESRWIFISFDPLDILKGAGIFSPEYASLLSDPANMLSGCFRCGELPAVESAARSIISASEVQDEYGEISLSLAITKMMIEAARAKKHTVSGEGRRSVIEHKRISPALKFIEKNLGSPEELNEGALSAVCGVSSATLRRLFTKHTGYPPKAFIIRSRMARAEYLLRSTSRSVLEISYEVGYGDISGFNRTFRSFFGYSPTQYRKM